MNKALYGMMLCLALSGLVLSGCEELLNAATGTKVTGVSLDQDNLTVAVNQSEVLTPTVTPPDAANKEVTWQSVDPAVATVLEGVVTGKKTGNTTIIVKTDDGGYIATCEVTVTAGTDPNNPEQPGTNPEQPGTDPEQPGTDPEQPGTNPEQPGTDPEQPGTDPEQPGTDPEQPGTDPEQPGTDPEQPGTNPEQPPVTQPTYYTVTFVNAGGTAIPPQNVAEGNSIIVPANPTKTGYRFLGWNTGNGYVQGGDNYTVNGDVTFQAEFIKQWTVTYYRNGSPVQITVDENSDAIDALQKLTLTAPVSGWSFEKWDWSGVLPEGANVSGIDSNITINPIWRTAEGVLVTDGPEFGQQKTETDGSGHFPGFVANAADIDIPENPEIGQDSIQGWYEIQQYGGGGKSEGDHTAAVTRVYGYMNVLVEQRNNLFTGYGALAAAYPNLTKFAGIKNAEQTAYKNGLTGTSDFRNLTASMANSVDAVLDAVFGASGAERSAFDTELNAYQQANYYKQKIIDKNAAPVISALSGVSISGMPAHSSTTDIENNIDSIISKLETSLLNKINTATQVNTITNMQDKSTVQKYNGYLLKQVGEDLYEINALADDMNTVGFENDMGMDWSYFTSVFAQVSQNEHLGTFMAQGFDPRVLREQQAAEPRIHRGETYG